MFRLYQLDGTTPVTIPQPQKATWDYPARDASADGGVRRSAFAIVEWTYSPKTPMSPANFLLLTTYRAANGWVTFDTWKKPQGASAGAFVKCQGYMSEPGGTLREGEYYSISVAFSAVREV